MVVPLDLRAPLLIVTLLSAALSGCIAAKEDDPNSGAAGWTETDDNETVAPPPIPPLVILYEKSWVGQETLGATFDVPDGYDYILTEFGHTGQVLGLPVVEDGDGNAMDSGTTSFTGGPMYLFRSMPATPGTASIELEAGPAIPGALAGVGGFSATALQGVPSLLLSLGWTGQRTDPVVLDTEIRFYVPAGVDDFTFAVEGSGQSTNGFRLIDPDGEEHFTGGQAVGPFSDQRSVTATEGIWSVVLEGLTNGPWSISAVTVTDAA